MCAPLQTGYLSAPNARRMHARLCQSMRTSTSSTTPLAVERRISWYADFLRRVLSELYPGVWNGDFAPSHSLRMIICALRTEYSYRKRYTFGFRTTHFVVLWLSLLRSLPAGTPTRRAPRDELVLHLLRMPGAARRSSSAKCSGNRCAN